jgi:hypothetical protein
MSAHLPLQEPLHGVSVPPPATGPRRPHPNAPPTPSALVAAIEPRAATSMLLDTATNPGIAMPTLLDADDPS